MLFRSRQIGRHALSEGVAGCVFIARNSDAICMQSNRQPKRRMSKKARSASRDDALIGTLYTTPSWISADAHHDLHIDAIVARGEHNERAYRTTHGPRLVDDRDRRRAWVRTSEHHGDGTVTAPWHIGVECKFNLGGTETREDTES